MKFFHFYVSTSSNEPYTFYGSGTKTEVRAAPECIPLFSYDTYTHPPGTRITHILCSLPSLSVTLLISSACYRDHDRWVYRTFLLKSFEYPQSESEHSCPDNTGPKDAVHYVEKPEPVLPGRCRFARLQELVYDL